MLIVNLIGCICLSIFISSSHAIYCLKYNLARFKIYYNKDRYLPNHNPSLYIATLKPFDCAKCLSFWLSLTLMLNYNYSALDAILTSITIYTITKQITKIK
jgi:hypothetical protein